MSDEQFNEVNRTLHQIGTAFDSFKTDHDDRLRDVESRIGGIEATNAATRHAAPMHGTSGSREAREFLLNEIARRPQAAVTVGSNPGGGNAAPEILSREVQSMMRRLSPMLDLVNVEKSTTGQWAKIVTDTKHASGWADEGDTRSETGTATIHKVSPTFGTLYAVPKASEESIDDIAAFDVARWFVSETSKAFAQQLGAAVVSGNGTARPTGILNGNAVSPLTIVATADGSSPERPFGSLEYIPTGAAAGFQDDWPGGAASPVQDPAGCFFDCLYALNEAYRQRAVWVMSSLTLARVRKFRDANGNYLFAPGLRTGDDATLLGRPVRVAEDLPNVGAGSIVAILADWEEAYTLVEASPLRVTRDEITTYGQVKLHVRQRWGGKLTNSDAAKCIKCSVS